MKNNHLTKKQKEELKLLMKEVSFEAKKVREDYKKNPSNMSGSIVQIHENSSILSENNKKA